MSQFQYTIVETKNATGIIKLNRPDVYNALNAKGKFEIISAIRELNKNTQIRSIILTAEGKAFCSGQDLTDKSVNSTDGSPVDIGRVLETEWNPLIEAIRGSEKPIIAAINGVCAGAGLSVVLATDLKVAAPKVRFISGFTQIGLAPDAGMSFTLVQALGYSRALDFSLFGKPLMSEEMQQYGLVNEVSENFLARAFEICDAINALPPLSVKMVKKNLHYASKNVFAEVIARETYAQRYLGFSQDYREGVSAFMEKRKPSFKGI
ncbi:MAG: enoyl-CoA hydratase/isomerase family protein [Bacteriovoracaceae bacterium]|nr:enoyl-CoA hydratase/isomerase family protein [Bacteriovoracaceae bacterium]